MLFFYKKNKLFIIFALINMHLLIKNVIIFQPHSDYHLKKQDILIQEGKIVNIQDSISPQPNDLIKDYEEAYLSLGWVDTHLPLTFPGDERRETLESLVNAAKGGGFTDVICVPTKLSAIDTPESLISLKSLTKDLAVKFHFVAAVTHQLNGKDLTEMGLLVQAGAIAFSNGNFPITDLNLLIRIFQYLQQFDLPFIINPHLPFFNDGQVNDSKIALQLGFKGIPIISETLVILQTLEILKYAPAKIHFSPVTTYEGWNLILQAQKNGFSVTADTASNYLYFNDTSCMNYNVLAKVFPPYRSAFNQNQLKTFIPYLQGIASLHYPVISEEKNLEFGLSEPGIIHLQTSVPVFAQFAALEEMIPILSQKPSVLFPNIHRQLKVGYPACFTIFKNESWKFTKALNGSLSNNSPYFDQTFDLKIIDTVL